jgi:hypothetical protein
MRRVTVSVLAGLILAATGCGPGEVVVSGIVTLNGKPLEDGYIAFRPLPATATSEAKGGPIKGGTFQVKARPGQYQVEITATQAATGPKGALGVTPPPTSLIPERYNGKSELTKEVRAGAPNEFEFALTSP